MADSCSSVTHLSSRKGAGESRKQTHRPRVRPLPPRGHCRDIGQRTRRRSPDSHVSTSCRKQKKKQARQRKGHLRLMSETASSMFEIEAPRRWANSVWSPRAWKQPGPGKTRPTCQHSAGAAASQQILWDGWADPRRDSQTSAACPMGTVSASTTVRLRLPTRARH